MGYRQVLGVGLGTVIGLGSGIGGVWGWHCHGKGRVPGYIIGWKQQTGMAQGDIHPCIISLTFGRVAPGSQSSTETWGDQMLLLKRSILAMYLVWWAFDTTSHS